MAEEVKYEHHHETKPTEEPCEATPTFKAEEHPTPAVESTDRGLFGFGAKKEEGKCEETVIAAEFEEKVQVCDAEEKKEEYKEEEKKHESLVQKLQRSSSSSSSSSDEEEIGEDGEKKKKKKALKEKIKEKISPEKEVEKVEEVKCEDTSVPVEKYEAAPAEEKKGFIEKIKEKLPGGKKTEEVAAPPPVAEYSAAPEVEESKEKKGFMDKIKEKLPGYHHKSDEEKEKEKAKDTTAC